MPWRPEDWSAWPTIDRVASYGEATHVRAVLDILNRLPGLEHKRLVELTRGQGSSLHQLSRRSAPALSVDLADGALGTRILPSSCDVIVAVDAIDSGDADEVFTEVRSALVEGGVFLATFTARASTPWVFASPLREPGAGFHEVELQFRLTRAVFQGLRLRRLRPAHEPERIVCMAVRRALN